MKKKRKEEIKEIIKINLLILFIVLILAKTGILTKIFDYIFIIY